MAKPWQKGKNPTVVNTNDFRTTHSQSTGSWTKAECPGYPLSFDGIAPCVLSPVQTFEVNQFVQMMNLAQTKPLSRGRPHLLDIGLASLLIALWIITLVVGFDISLTHVPWVVTVVGVLARTFLHTGLFIVTHEAIHRNISRNSIFNDCFGYVTSSLYALLPYAVLAKNHRLHH